MSPPRAALIVAPFLNVFKTVLKRMMETASLDTPSPKTTLKSLGCSAESINEIAATTSDEHISEHRSRISITSNFNSDCTLVALFPARTVLLLRSAINRVCIWLQHVPKQVLPEHQQRGLVRGVLDVRVLHDVLSGGYLVLKQLPNDSVGLGSKKPELVSFFP